MGNEQSGAPSYRADYRAHPAVPPRTESPAERQERLQRAAAYEEKMRRFRGKDPELLKQENWRKYDAIGKQTTGSASASASTVPPPPPQWKTTSTASVSPPPVAAGYPGAVGPHAVQPRRAPTGGSGYVGTAAASPSAPPSSSSSSSSSPASFPFDPNPARAARAAAMTAKTAKIKSYKPAGKADQWETYKQLEAMEKGKTAAVPVPITATPGYGRGVFPTEEEVEAEETKGDEAGAEADAGSNSSSAFYQQMFHLTSKAQRMPHSSLLLLIKIITNLLRSDSTPDGSKFRRLKLDSEKMQKEIVAVDGAVEVLFAVGFQRGVGEGGEDLLVCGGETDLGVARLALEKLQALADRK